jgi:molecular chaperone DnaK (HSP70)
MSGDAPLPDTSRYVIGIDLGTTNSALAYVDAHESPWTVRTFAIPQFVEAGTVQPQDTLPSFHYEPANGEFPAESLRLPWTAAGGTEPSFVGSFARDHGGQVPGRLVSSAKSWLCHPGVDRESDLLPWHGLPDASRISPIEASARYLRHMQRAWDHAHPDEPLAKQDVVLTLPASFDEIARELTVRAARKAGLPRVWLVEEPQAAFYAWLHKHAGDWERRVRAGQTILVCDIGGGTSDFTLIRVRPAEATESTTTTRPRRSSQRGLVKFHRVAVGEHLILGGDNLDLALARRVEERLLGPDKHLDPLPWGQLLRACRRVKEQMLGEEPPDETTINLGGTGRKLIGGALRCTVTRDEVREWLVEGFLPPLAKDTLPERRRAAFQEFGLPFAPDARITAYLASFLSAHARAASDDPTQPVPAGAMARPDLILFNGGFFESPILRARLLDVLSSWFAGSGKKPWQPEVLDHDRLDLAVARGAAYYGMVRRGMGVAISAALPRSYYLGVAAGDDAFERRAMCVVPAGTEPGSETDLSSHNFELLYGRPVEFPLYVSSTRLIDPAGEIVPVEAEHLRPLAPLRTVLEGAKRGETGTVPVRVRARLTEIGTLDLWCEEVESRRKWKLQFDVRSAVETDIDSTLTSGEAAGILDEDRIDAARELARQTFARNDGPSPEGLMKGIGEALGLPRDEWPAVPLRRLWETLLEEAEGRRRGPNHEARWLNLAGFALRPGYGVAADDWRVAETRRVVGDKLLHGLAQCRNEWWVFWRRIAGGLTGGQQTSLATGPLNQLRAWGKSARAGSTRTTPGPDALGGPTGIEMLRFLAGCEQLPIPTKLEIGRLMRDVLISRAAPPWDRALIWGLGRIGSRELLYGPLNLVLPSDVVAGWTEDLLTGGFDPGATKLALLQLARRTQDRHRDLPEALRLRAAAWLEDAAGTNDRERTEHAKLLREGGRLTSETRAAVFGEGLPTGLAVRM